MTTKAIRSTRCIFLACLVLLLLSTSCQQAPRPAPANMITPPTVTPVPTATAVPRPPISAADVKSLAAPFDKVSKAYVQAWNTHDTKNMAPLLTDDVLYYEEGNKPMTSTAGGLLGTNWIVLHGSPNFEGKQTDLFVSRDSAFDIWEMWNYDEAAGPQGKDNPVTGYDWYTLRDGKIASIWLFWSPEHLMAGFDIAFSEKPLQDYDKAWSSGDPKTIAALYAPDAVRHDTLFGDDQNGPSAIQEYAANFFSWYPDVSLERLKSFQLGHSVPVKTGGVYILHARDHAGKPCDIQAIILLESPVLDDLSTGKIINEWWFYQPDSLIACGWAQ